MEQIVMKKGRPRLARLTFYKDYRVGDGGPPYGYARFDTVELDMAGYKTAVARHGQAAYQLLALVQEHGTPHGNKLTLPADQDYRDGSYEQEYALPRWLTRAKVEEMVPPGSP